MKKLNYILFVLFALGTSSWSMKLDPNAFCSVMDKCIGQTPSFCTAKLKTPVEDVVYNKEFCEAPKEMVQRGVLATKKFGPKYEAWTRLGQEYRMEYEVTGTLPVGREAMNYLMDNLNFAARLINSYQETEYEGGYHSGSTTKFSGRKGDRLRGDFEFLYKDSSYSRNIIFGTGYVEVLAWTLVGDATVFLDYVNVSPTQTAFRLTVLAFPANSFVNSIMSMGFFRRKVISYLNEILEDVEASAVALSKDELYKEGKWLKGKKWEKHIEVLKSKMGKHGVDVKK